VSDLTPDERRVLRSVSWLDAFDLTLATAAVGLPHEAPAQRLIERPFVRENVFGLWPYHLHGLIRSTIHSADATDDRWTDGDWQQAAERARVEPLFGLPPRPRRPPAVRLLPGQWVRWQLNYRFTSALGIRGWSYWLDTFNIAYGPVDRDVFLSEPTVIVDECGPVR
jgi:hypothetical protein